jgi:hypothetical protein
MRNRTMTRLLSVVLTALLACGGEPNPIIPPPPPPPADAALRVAFLGNSLTATFGIPSMVAEFAVQGGALRPVISVSAPGGFGLEDHWAYPQSRLIFENSDIDVLVMQQGPSTLDESRENLILWSATIRNHITKSGVRSGLFVVWPPEGSSLGATIANYTTAAQTNGLALYPAGQAWREAWRLDPSIPLYSSDRFHPSRTGAMLAAMTIAATIFDQDPNEYTNLFPLFVPESEMPTLRAAAVYATEQYGVR